MEVSEYPKGLLVIDPDKLGQNKRCFLFSLPPPPSSIVCDWPIIILKLLFSHKDIHLF